MSGFGVLGQMMNHKRDMDGNTVLALTPLGERKADCFDASGNRWRVLTYLREHGASTIIEISNALGMRPQKTKAIVKSLKSCGYVRDGSGDE